MGMHLREDGAREMVYEASPTISAFHNSPAFVRGIMGPIGSGKSVGLIHEVFRLAQREVVQADGIRRSRWAVIRNTYPELKTTTINTFLDWFDEVSEITYGAPITAIVEVDDIRLEIYFLALDQPKDVKKLKSLELTGVAINEASEISKDVLDMATGRVGRYPAKRDGGMRRACVIMDTNPPDDDHWWYTLFEEQQPEDYALFKQPPALLKLPSKSGKSVYMPNPDAENVQHQPLGAKYWTNQVFGKRDAWISVYLMGKYGSTSDGRPCFPNFNDHVHVAKESLHVFENMPLLLGWDYGRTPACIIGQLSPLGQLRILEELVVEHDGHGMGIRKFTRDVVKPFVDTHYPGFRLQSWGDPAGDNQGEQIEDTCMKIQGDEGIPTEPALSNEIKYRFENVDYYLMRLVDGKPGIVLDPKIKVLRKGLNGGYEFERVQVSGEARYKDQPKKNRFSHPCDALQYLCDLAKNGIVKFESNKVAHEVGNALVSAAGWT